MKGKWTAFAIACVLATVAIILGCRWFGPHDLYEKDQPKTMAYTADIVLHGRFALPRDMIYQPATKPPLYNWIDAALVGSTGVWNEWTLKFPSVLGVFGTGAIVFAMARRATRGRAESLVVGLLAVGIWFTFGSDIRHGSVLRLSYLARPDMLLTMFCTAAWALLTVAVDRSTARAALVPAVVGWLCVAAAALTKGPAAILPAIYAVIYGISGGVRGEAPANLQSSQIPDRLLRLWPAIGLPVALLPPGLWFWFARRQDARHVYDVIWNAEVAGRAFHTPEGFRNPWYDSAMWFVTKAWPWGGVAVVALLLTAWLPRLRRAAGPAALYLVIVLIGLSLPAAKRMDYLLPAFAPAAVLVAIFAADVARHRVVGVFAIVAVPAAVVVVVLGKHSATDWLLPLGLAVVASACLLFEKRRTVPLAIVTIAPLLLSIGMARAHTRRSLEAVNRWSDAAVQFVSAVKQRVPADAKLLVVVRGKHPLAVLLGRHQGSCLTSSDLASAEYIILPQQTGLTADLFSRPLPIGFDVVENRDLATLGLYRHVPLDRLIAAQKACAEWTTTENPYHAPGTVFRDE